MPSHTTLKGVSQVGDSLLSDQLEANVYSFFQWGFLGAGGFFNVSIPTSGCYGGEQSRLRLVNDPNYEQGRVWETFRKDWVWESGVEYTSQPIRVSGVYVNGAFKPVTGSGAFSHTYDYPNGRVIFDSPISSTGTVQAEYSYRLFQMYTANAPWWQQVQTNSFRVDDSHFLLKGSGAWDVLGQSRVQLPAVVVEAVPRTDRRPKSIGSSNAIVRQDIIFHVLADDRWNMNWLHDAITNQWQKRIQGFDKNRLFAEDAYPLEVGMPKNNSLMYPDLVKTSGEGGYFWEQIRVDKMTSQDHRVFGGVHYATIRGTFEVDLP